MALSLSLKLDGPIDSDATQQRVRSRLRICHWQKIEFEEESKSKSHKSNDLLSLSEDDLPSK